MCYLYDTLHEMFETRELNVELFKTFYEKYKDNELLIKGVVKAIKNRGWLTLDIKNMTNTDIKISKFDEEGRYMPFTKMDNFIVNSIKTDNAGDFSQLLTDQTEALIYDINEIFKMIFYYNAIKCLKFLLLQKDKKYIKKYIKNCCKRSFEFNEHEHKKFKYISNNADMIHLIRSELALRKPSSICYNVISPNITYEPMLYNDALFGLNFNVMENVHNALLSTFGNIEIIKGKLVRLLTPSMACILYKNINCKRDVYELNRYYTYSCKALSEYIDYLCKMYFDEVYDKELMGIVIEKMTFITKYMLFYNIPFFNKYTELYIAAFGDYNVDLSNNYIYKMLSQENKNIIDVFMIINKIRNKTNKIGGMVSRWRDEQWYEYNNRFRLDDTSMLIDKVSKSVNIKIDLSKLKSNVNKIDELNAPETKHTKNELNPYIDLFNSAFNEIV